MSKPLTSIDALLEQHRKRANGVLTLRQGTITRAVTFKKGLITHVESNIREETLGSLLVREKRITDEKLQEVLKVMMEKRTLLGDTLVGMEILQPTEVFAYLTQQMTEKLRNCLQMQEVTAIFSPEIDKKNPDFVIPFFRTLIDGIVQYYSPDRYKKEARFQRDAMLSLNEPGRAVLPQLQLVTEEMKMLRLIDGQTRMSDFLSRSTNKRIAAALAFFLDKLGFLDVTLAPAAETQPENNDKLFDTAEHLIPAESVKLKAPEKSPEKSPEMSPEKNKDPAKGTNQANANTTNKMLNLLLRLKTMNYWAILNLPEEAPTAQAERAYHLLCKQHHLGQIEQFYEAKDVPHAKQLLDVLTMAYSVLSDVKRATAYQANLKAKKEPPPLDDNLRAEIEALKSDFFNRLNNGKNALSHIAEAIRLNAKEASYYVRQAQIQMKLDTQGGAPPSKQVEESLRKALEINPQNWEANLEMGNNFKLAKNPDKALNFFRRALEQNSRSRQAEVEIRLLESRQEKAKGSELFASFRMGGKSGAKAGKEPKDE